MFSARNWLSLFGFVLLLSACAQKIPNIRGCAVAGYLADGADCASTLEDGTLSLSLDQVIEMLEPQLERECVPVPGMNLCDPAGQGELVKLPPRGGGILISSEDFMDVKIFIEQTCRKIRCTTEVLKALERMDRVTRLRASE